MIASLYQSGITLRLQIFFTLRLSVRLQCALCRSMALLHCG